VTWCFWSFAFTTTLSLPYGGTNGFYFFPLLIFAPFASYPFGFSPDVLAMCEYSSSRLRQISSRFSSFVFHSSAYIGSFTRVQLALYSSSGQSLIISSDIITGRLTLTRAASKINTLFEPKKQNISYVTLFFSRAFRAVAARRACNLSTNEWRRRKGTLCTILSRLPSL